MPAAKPSSKQRVLEVIDLLDDDSGPLLMPKLRYALRLECGHTVLRATNVNCAYNAYTPGGKGGRCALCEICRLHRRARQG